MKVTYFSTDTLLVSFSDRRIAETRGLDETGHVVGLTTEHAKQQMDVNEFSYTNSPEPNDNPSVAIL